MKKVAIEFSEELGQLTEKERQKLSALRYDVQHAADQLDRGEGIRDFDYKAFLAERRRLHVGKQV